MYRTVLLKKLYFNIINYIKRLQYTAKWALDMNYAATNVLTNFVILYRKPAVYG